MTFAKTLAAAALIVAALTVAVPASARDNHHRHEHKVCKWERHHGHREKVCHWVRN